MKFLSALIAMLCLVACGSENSSTTDSSENQPVEEKKAEEFFGFNIEEHKIVHDTIENNQFLSEILLPFKVSYVDIDGIAKNSKDVFDVRRMKAGRPYHMVCTNDTTEEVQCMIYEQDPVNYVTFHFGDSLYATTGKREIEIKENEASGVVTSSLFLAMTENDLSPALAMELADIYAWTVDFYRLQKGDRFKIIFDERYVDGNFIGIGDVKAAYFEHQKEPFYAFRFEEDSIPRYFDDEGNGLKKAFLKSPLKFGRLTSRYTMRRFHPVQKRNKPHLGTDYAAATGTPILATGDGAVIESARKRANGNYVKIRHNSTYTTQYLHMSKRAVNVGDFVKQGQVIGYVGSTGLATGPHVCYRFWKNGSQVDHLREKFEPSKPLKEELVAEFEEYKSVIKKQLDNIPYTEKDEELLTSLNQ